MRWLGNGGCKIIRTRLLRLEKLTCYNEVVALIQEAIDATLREDLVRVEEEIVNWRKSAWV